MRRKDREITDFQEIVEIIKKCDVCRLALHDEEYPYILPLNFGMQVEDGKIVLYFHGAKQGKKYELIAKNPKVSFEMDCGHELLLITEKGDCTMDFESVIGQGTIEMVPEEEKQDALCVLMKHYHQETFAFDKRMIPATTVMRLRVDSCTAKLHKTKK